MTRQMLKILRPLFAFACGSAVMLLLLGTAYADPVVAVTPTGLQLSWQAWMMVGLAAAGGALKILDVLIAGLRWLAPRTKTMVDDRARDDLQIVRDDIQSVLRVVGGLVPATGVPTATSERPTAPATPQNVVSIVSGSGGGAAAVLLAFTIGAAGLSMLAGCINPKVKAIESAVWNCTAPERAEAVAAVTPAVVSVIKAAGSADGKQIDLSTVKSAISKANVLSEAGILLSCALASAVAILEAPAPAPPPGSAAAAPFVLDPTAVRAVWDVIKRDQLGGASFQVAGGTVL